MWAEQPTSTSSRQLSVLSTCLLTDWISVKGHWINVQRVIQLQSTLSPANLYCKCTLASSHISMTKAVSLQTLSTWISMLFSSCSACPQWVGLLISGSQIDSYLLTAVCFQVLPHGPPGVGASLLPLRPVPRLPCPAPCHKPGNEQAGDHGDLGGAQEEL